MAADVHHLEDGVPVADVYVGDEFVSRYYSVFCLNKSFKYVRIHSETKVLVAPQKTANSQ